MLNADSNRPHRSDDPPPAAARRRRDVPTTGHADDRRPDACTVPQGHQRARGRAQLGTDIAVLLLPPGPVVAGGVPPVPGRRQGQPKPVPSLLHAGAPTDGRASPRAARARRRARADARVHAASTTRSTARSATRPASARCRSMYFDWDSASSRATTASRSTRPRSSTSARTSCSIRSAASCARAASASATRSPAAPARDGQPRRSRGADHGAGRAARQPVLAQHRRRLPGRRADRRRTSASRCAPGSSTSTPSVCTGCATGCNIEIHHTRGRDLAPGAARQPESTSTGCATRAASPTRRVHEERLAAAARRRRCRPSWDRALDAAGERLARRSTRTPAQVGVVLSAQSHQRGLLRARAAGVRAPGASARRTSPAATRAGSDDILRQRRHQPEHRGRRWRSARAGCRACWTWPTTSSSGAVTALLVLGDRRRARRRDARRRRCRSKARGAGRRSARTTSAAGRRARRSRCRWPLGRGRRHVHQRQGMVQRMHAAFPPPGDALPGWEIVVAPRARDWARTHGLHRRAKAVFTEANDRSCRS